MEITVILIFRQDFVRKLRSDNGSKTVYKNINFFLTFLYNNLYKMKIFVTCIRKVFKFIELYTTPDYSFHENGL